MSESGDEYSTDGVEVPLAFRVPIVETLCTVKDQGATEEFSRLLIVQKRVFEQALTARIKFHGHAPPHGLFPVRYYR
jgi:hypothetical protein